MCIRDSSYIVYGPLIGGQATVLYEGTPVRPDGAIQMCIRDRRKIRAISPYSARTCANRGGNGIDN